MDHQPRAARHLVTVVLALATLAFAAAAAAQGAKARATHAKRTSHHAHHAQRPAPRPVAVPVFDPREVMRDPAPLAREFDRWLDEAAASSAIVGLSAAIVDGRQVLLERSLGYTNATTKEPVTPETVFRLASLSKAFAATLTGLLVDRGRLSWDTRITDVVPTFALADVTDSQRLDVRDILSHRVGLPHNTYDRLIEQDEPYRLLIDRLREVPLVCPVGDCYGYQNVAFSLIGDVVFATTGDFFYHEVGKRIFHPLGMLTASYGLESLEQSASWARPHVHEGGQWVPVMPNDTYYRLDPAAGVNASIRDLEDWLIAQMGGRPNVLPASLLDELHKPLVETASEKHASAWRRGRLLDAQYALGWRVYDYAGATLLFHAGAVQGYRAIIAFLPKHRFGIVMTWNDESALPVGLVPMLFDRYLGLPRENWAGIDSGKDEEFTGGAE